MSNVIFDRLTEIHERITRSLDELRDISDNQPMPRNVREELFAARGKLDHANEHIYTATERGWPDEHTEWGIEKGWFDPKDWED